MPVYLGFHLGHDSNMAVAVDGKVRYRKLERISGDKHATSGDINFVFNTLGDWGIKNIDYCAYTNADNGSSQCEKEKFFCNGNIKEFKSFVIDHHYAHTLSIWPIIETEKLDYAVSVDGRGDWQRSAMVIKNPAKNPVMIGAEYGWGCGWEFYQIGKALGFKGLEYDFAGKLMGLQAYSEKEMLEKFGILPLRETNYASSVESANNYNTIAGFHNYWWEKTRALFQFDKHKVIGYSGGCAQNTVYNYWLKREFPNLWIPPHCYDGGLSLGCLEFLRLYFNADKFDTNGFPYWQDDPCPELPTQRTIEETARLLSRGKIVGWMQGRGEIGPRALGNRSILMAANKAENKDILNAKVKKREAWRPYAGSVMSEYARDYFDMNESEYMLYACQVLQKGIPAITHVDNTCRMQTVKNGLFYDLIKEYHKLTSIPIILNTSLNIARKPIISKKEDAINLLHSSEMDALVVGDKLYVKGKMFL